MRKSLGIVMCLLWVGGCMGGGGQEAVRGESGALLASHFGPAPTAEYVVKGQASAQLSGAHCCNGSGFPGSFEARIRQTEHGPEIASLQVLLDDTTQRVSLSTGEEVAVWFENLWNSVSGRQPRQLTMTFVEGFAVTETPAVGVLSPAGGYEVAGGMRFRTGGYANREKTQAYAPLTSQSGPLTFAFDPRSGGAFELRTSYGVNTDDGVYQVRVLARGQTVNTPAQAFGGIAEVRVEGEEPKTSGCPARVQLENYSRPGSIDLQSAEGSVVEMLNTSQDAENNILGEQFVVIGAGGAELARTSARRFSVHLPPGEVAWEVREVDTEGAESRYLCEAIVEDISAPLVQALPSTVECSEWGGASQRTSDALGSWLLQAKGLDRLDGQLPARAVLGGAPVETSTLFALGANAVGFESVDAAGNTGRGNAVLTVTDTTAPLGWVLPRSFSVPGDGDMQGVELSVGSWDACTTSRWTLYKVLRDGRDAGDDVSQATLGTADDHFKVRGVPGAKYTIVVQITDASGNASLAVTNVEVR